MAGKFPVELNAFDVVYYNGESLMNETLERRREVLEKIINEKKADVFTTRSPAHGYRKEKRHFPIVSPFVIFLFIIFLSG